MEPFIAWVVIILTLPFVATTPKTTIVLLDNNSTHNGIDISTFSGKTTIDQPYYATTLEKPSEVTKVDPAQINAKYGSVLHILPSKPVSTLFYFEQATAELTQSSKDQIEALVQTIISRQPVSVDIIGHSDRAGDADTNYQLALERAKELQQFLLERNISLERCSVVSYGEDDPLIPTDDGVLEPQNRRVEVIVR